LSEGFGTDEITECSPNATGSKVQFPDKSMTYFSLHNMKRGEVKMRYPNGAPCIVVSKLGKGKIIFLGLSIGKMAGQSGYSNIDDAMLMDKKKNGDIGKGMTLSDKIKLLATRAVSDCLRASNKMKVF
jgi:hypothetical protein